MLLSLSKKQIEVLLESAKFKLEYNNQRHTEEDKKKMSIDECINLNQKQFELELSICILEKLLKD